MNAQLESAIADTLRFYRLGNRLSQKALAEKCGIGEKTISSFESGARASAITLAQLFAMFMVTGHSLQDFFVEVGLWTDENHVSVSGRRVQRSQRLPA